MSPARARAWSAVELANPPQPTYADQKVISPRVLTLIGSLLSVLCWKLVEKIVSVRPPPHYAERIWKQRFHFENRSNVFRSHYAGGIFKRNNHRSFWICVWGNLWQGNHMTIVTSSSLKSFIFKMFSGHSKKESWCLWTPPVWRLFSKNYVFMKD